VSHLQSRRVRQSALGTLVAAALCGAGFGAEAQVRVPDAAGGHRMTVTSYRDLPFRTVVRQQYDYSCGSAALATLLAYHYGRQVSEAEVFKAMYAAGEQETIKRYGFSLLDMQGYLTKLGYKSDGYKSSLDALAKTGAPAIAVITVASYRHFVVIKGVRPNEVLVGDPALGLKIYSRSDFQKVWDGVLFVVHGPPGAGEFNRKSEWRKWASAPAAGPLGSALSADSLSAFTRELPPIYQVTTAISMERPF
jgi:uncharacterized protein